MSIRKGRASSPQIEQVAGNGLLNRRALLRGGAVVAGAMTSGAALTSAAAEPLQNDAWSLEKGLVVPPYQVPSRFEKDVVRTAQQSEQRVPDFARAHPAPDAARYDNAQRPVLLDLPFRHSRYRSGAAQAGHPRASEAAAGLHPGVAVALPDGHAHAFPRMQRQFGADVLQ
jgi:hypothetical protein